VSVLLAPDQDGVAEQPAIAALRAALDRLQVRLSVHDPADQSALSYLAAAKDASPIYLNRALCDADVVLPVGTTRPESSLGYLGIPGGLYPTFSDESTLRRFRAPAAARHAGQNAKRRDQAAEVAWLLGVSLFLQVVPGSGTSLLHVVAGQPDRVATECRQLCERAWVHRVPRKADLVVAAIEGDSTEQTWDNLGRALFSASQICTDNGTIVLCTDLNRPPGPALRQLANAAEDEQARRQVLRQRSADAVAATVLLETRDRQHVYLLSRLDAEFVESLGCGYVPDPFTVERLAEQSASCILLADAHRAQLEPVE
jgi:nickel-dependent lactate racemase